VLVEDDPDDTYFVRHALSAARIKNHIVACRNAAEARELVTRRVVPSSPALFVLDIDLGPQESGLGLLRWIRAQPPPLGTTPVMMLTGSHDSEHRAEANVLGAIWFLTKPVAEEELVRAIQALGLTVTTSMISGEVSFRLIERV
jgi:DNA-binding response OmpR family regulator